MDFPNGIEFVILCLQTSDKIHLTVQIQADKHLQQMRGVSKDRRTTGTMGLTAGVSSATVAKKSQMRPFHGKNVSDWNRKEAPLPACLQRNFPKANIVPYTRCRSKPTSIVRSNTTSDTKTARIVFVVTSVFNITQTLCVGSHVAWICRQVDLQNPKTCGWGHSPVQYLFNNISHEFFRSIG